MDKYIIFLQKIPLIQKIMLTFIRKAYIAIVKRKMFYFYSIFQNNIKNTSHIKKLLELTLKIFLIRIILLSNIFVHSLPRMPLFFEFRSNMTGRRIFRFFF